MDGKGDERGEGGGEGREGRRGRGRARGEEVAVAEGNTVHYYSAVKNRVCLFYRTSYYHRSIPDACSTNDLKHVVCVFFTWLESARPTQ